MVSLLPGTEQIISNLDDPWIAEQFRIRYKSVTNLTFFCTLFILTYFFLESFTSFVRCIYFRKIVEDKFIKLEDEIKKEYDKVSKKTQDRLQLITIKNDSEAKTKR